MIKAAKGVGLTATVGGMVFDLNDRQGLYLLAYDLGLANSRRLGQQSPLQQGVTDLGQRTDARYVSLAMRLVGRDLAHYRTLREAVMTAFRARESDPMQLVFDFGGGLRRATDVYLDGNLDWSNRQAWAEQVGGVFRAADWRLYDPVQRELLFSIAGIDEGWAIPWEIPWSVGLAVINDEMDFEYAGASPLASVEYPLIRIVGPIANPVISNVTTGERLALTDNGGLVLGEGERVDIDLAGAPRRDARTIRAQAGESLAQYLSVDSDLATWHFAYKGERLRDGSYATGTNTIGVTGTGVNSNTRITLAYYDRYEGV